MIQRIAYSSGATNDAWFGGIAISTTIVLVGICFILVFGVIPWVKKNPPWIWPKQFVKNAQALARNLTE